MTDFVFEQWANLYKTDPDAFEKRRIDALQSLIDQADPEQQSAMGHTLFRIEMTRRVSKSPLQAALKSADLMWESYEKLQKHISATAHCLSNAHRAEPRPGLVQTLKPSIDTLDANEAKIIPLKRRS